METDSLRSTANPKGKNKVGTEDNIEAVNSSILSNKGTTTNKLPPLPLNRGDHQAGKGGSSNSNLEAELMFVDPKHRRQDGELSGPDNQQGLATGLNTMVSTDGGLVGPEQ